MYDYNTDERNDERRQNGTGGGVRLERRERPKRQSFQVDSYIRVQLDADLAKALADLILNSETDNPALVALAKQLDNA